MAAVFAADDRAAKATSKLVDWTGKRAAFLWSLRTVAPGTGLWRRFDVLRGIRDEGDVTRKFMEARCDRGAEIARMLLVSEETATAIRSLDEHWDGRGMPDGLQGEDIPLAARILCLAQTIEVFHAASGVRAARKMARLRRGRWFDPSLVDAFMRPYRGPLPPEEALGIIDRDVPDRLHADVRDALEKHLERTSGRVVDRPETPGFV